MFTSRNCVVVVRVIIMINCDHAVVRHLVVEQATIVIVGIRAVQSVAAYAPCCNRTFGHFCDQENMYSASFESS